MNPNSLKGQPALVTGANSGIGYAVANALAAAGAPVVVNYVANPPAAERVVDEIRNAGGEAMAIRADVSREDEVQAMFRKMFDAYGTIHLLVDNAGLQRDARIGEPEDIGRAAVWLASPLKTKSVSSKAASPGRAFTAADARRR